VSRGGFFPLPYLFGGPRLLDLFRLLFLLDLLETGRPDLEPVLFLTVKPRFFFPVLFRAGNPPLHPADAVPPFKSPNSLPTSTRPLGSFFF